MGFCLCPLFLSNKSFLLSYPSSHNSRPHACPSVSAMDVWYFSTAFTPSLPPSSFYSYFLSSRGPLARLASPPPARITHLRPSPFHPLSFLLLSLESVLKPLTHIEYVSTALQGILSSRLQAPSLVRYLPAAKQSARLTGRKGRQAGR